MQSHAQLQATLPLLSTCGASRTGYHSVASALGGRQATHASRHPASTSSSREMSSDAAAKGPEHQRETPLREARGRMAEPQQAERENALCAAEASRASGGRETGNAAFAVSRLLAGWLAGCCYHPPHLVTHLVGRSVGALLGGAGDRPRAAAGTHAHLVSSTGSLSLGGIGTNGRPALRAPRRTQATNTRRSMDVSGHRIPIRAAPVAGHEKKRSGRGGARTGGFGRRMRREK